jgi:hypothetical protein
MNGIVVEYKGRKYVVPFEIVVESEEHNNRCDGVSYYTDGKEFWGRYWTTSLALDRCGKCGEFYTEYKNCGCEEDFFKITKEEFMEEAFKQGLAVEISLTVAEVKEIKAEIEKIEQKLEKLKEMVKEIKYILPCI